MIKKTIISLFLMVCAFNVLASELNVKFNKNLSLTVLTEKEIMDGIDDRVFNAYGAKGLSINPFEKSEYLVVFDDHSKEEVFRSFVGAYQLSLNIKLDDLKKRNTISKVEIPKIRYIFDNMSDNEIKQVGSIKFINVNSDFRKKARRYVVNTDGVLHYHGLLLLTDEYLSKTKKEKATKSNVHALASFIFLGSGNEGFFPDLFRFYMGEAIGGNEKNSDSLTAWYIKVSASYVKRMMESGLSLDFILNDKVILNDVIEVITSTEYDQLAVYKNTDIAEANAKLAIYWKQAIYSIINANLKYNYSSCMGIYSLTTGEDILSSLRSSAGDELACKIGDMIRDKRLDSSLINQLARKNRAEFFSFSPVKEVIVLKSEKAWSVMTGLDNSYPVVDIFKAIKL